MASPLCNLPFPISELTWDKFQVVKKHLKVSKAECVTILCHVLGPPPGPLPATWLIIINPNKDVVLFIFYQSLRLCSRVHICIHIVNLYIYIYASKK